MQSDLLMITMERKFVQFKCSVGAVDQQYNWILLWSCADTLKISGCHYY